MNTVRANGLDFAYLEEGTGPLVLLVHGFPDTMHSWDRVRPALARAGYRAVSPNTRGYSPTEVPRDGRYDVQTLGRDIIALLAALASPGERAIVVAHDFGAAAAYVAAAMAPEVMRLLVTVGLPHPAAIKPTPGKLWAVRHFVSLRVPGAAARVRRNDFAHVDTLVQRWSPGWNVPRGETNAVKESFRAKGSLEAALGYYRAMAPGLTPPEKAKISVPCVTFAALRDGILGIDDYERARRKFTGGYEVVPMDVGHFVHRQSPDEFVTKLLDVLARHAPVF